MVEFLSGASWPSPWGWICKLSGRRRGIGKHWDGGVLMFIDPSVTSPGLVWSWMVHGLTGCTAPHSRRSHPGSVKGCLVINHQQCRNRWTGLLSLWVSGGQRDPAFCCCGVTRPWTFHQDKRGEPLAFVWMGCLTACLSLHNSPGISDKEEQTTWC